MALLGTRLKQARLAAGLTQADLARRVGLAGQQSIEAIEVGRSRNPTRIRELARACGVSMDWLLAGRRTVHPGEPTKVDPAGVAANSVPTDRSVPEYALPRLAQGSPGAVAPETDWYDRAAVDRWRLPGSYVEGELGLDFATSRIIRIRGNAMDDGSSRSLVSGDRVIIDCDDLDAGQGGMFAVFDGEGVIVRQVEVVSTFGQTLLRCRSLNRQYDPIDLVLAGRVEIIGRIVSVISRR